MLTGLCKFIQKYFSVIHSKIRLWLLKIITRIQGFRGKVLNKKIQFHCDLITNSATLCLWCICGKLNMRHRRLKISASLCHDQDIDKQEKLQSYHKHAHKQNRPTEMTKAERGSYSCLMEKKNDIAPP